LLSVFSVVIGSLRRNQEIVSVVKPSDEALLPIGSIFFSTAVLSGRAQLDRSRASGRTISIKFAFVAKVDGHFNRGRAGRIGGDCTPVGYQATAGLCPRHEAGIGECREPCDWVERRAERDSSVDEQSAVIINREAGRLTGDPTPWWLALATLFCVFLGG
jgi:hypothetical protein